MKTALVVGGSKEVWDEVSAAQKLCKFDKIYCVKMSGIFWPDKHFTWVTLHPEAMDDYEKQRARKGFDPCDDIVAPPAQEVGMHGQKGRITRRVSYQFEDSGPSAGSGIYGAKVALYDGCTNIVLAGIPMAAGGGHFLPESKNVKGHVRGKIWADVNAFIPGFNKAVPILMGKVKSMSGFTQQVLGAPSVEWLTDQMEKAV